MKRISYATWLIEGPAGRVLVRRISVRHYVVGNASRPLMPGFFCRKFRLKRDAVALAKDMAGVNKRANQQNQQISLECQQSAP